NAPIYTLFYDEKLTHGLFKGKTIHTSFLQKTPFVKKYHWFFPMTMPIAIEQFDFSEYDVVISLSASFAKGIITPPHTKHLCFCLTPPRFLWVKSQRFLDEFGYPKVLRMFIPFALTYLRVWDKEAA